MISWCVQGQRYLHSADAVFSFDIYNKIINIYITVALSVVFYGFKTCCFILRENHRLREFKNRVFTKIFWPKRGKVTIDWERFHNEEPHDLYSSSNTIKLTKSRSMRCAGHVARMRGTRNAYVVLVRQP
jgi:hypothetical protein